jgi:hypothetical protein
MRQRRGREASGDEVGARHIPPPPPASLACQSPVLVGWAVVTVPLIRTICSWDGGGVNPLRRPSPEAAAIGRTWMEDARDRDQGPA